MIRKANLIMYMYSIYFSFKRNMDEAVMKNDILQFKLNLKREMS